MKMNFKILNDLATIPTIGSKEAAGYDLYAATAEPIVIAPHTTVKIGTGIAAAIPEKTFGAIFARSGIATKRGLRPANAVGVIDSDYRGELIVALHNDLDTPQTIEAKERIAQLIIIPYVHVKLNQVENLDETERNTGGFGSTGTN